MINTIIKQQDDRTLDKKLSDFINYWDYKLAKPLLFLLGFLTLLVLFSLPLILITKKPILGLLGIIPALIISIKDTAK